MYALFSRQVISLSIPHYSMPRRWKHTSETEVLMSNDSCWFVLKQICVLKSECLSIHVISLYHSPSHETSPIKHRQAFLGSIPIHPLIITNNHHHVPSIPSQHYPHIKLYLLSQHGSFIDGFSRKQFIYCSIKDE